MDRTEQNLQQLVGKIENVPTLPQVVARVMAATQDPKTSAEDVNRIILTDQALTAKILKLVNSAFYGFPRRIGTVTEAVVILGFGTIRNLAVTASVFHSFGMKGMGTFNREAFWTHCAAVGTICRIVARKVHMPNQEDVFIAGLLHDLGKVVLDHYFHKEFTQALKQVGEDQCSLYEAEQKVFGVSHAEVGKWLAEHWNMPDFLVWSIGYHHEPQKVPGDSPVVALVHIADAVARYKEIGSGGDPSKPVIRKEAMEKLNFDKDLLDHVLELVDKEIEDANQFVSTF